METSYEHPFDEEPPTTNKRWRRYGEARRKELIDNDEWAGGTSFRLNKDCHANKYFELAQHVIDEFKELCDNLDTKAEEAYVMGHRLIAFLSLALPQHPQYMKIASLRCKVQQTLCWIREKMIKVALVIDEEQLNKFILNDFNPDPVDDDDDDDDGDESIKSSADLKQGQDFFSLKSQEEVWERFDGWSVDLKDSRGIPAHVETDSSSSTEESCSESETETDDGEPRKRQVPTYPAEDKEIEAADPELYLLNMDSLDDDDDDDDEGYQPPSITYEIENTVLKSKFLRRVANEDVNFETDSDAVDSWAQNGSEVQSSSSGRSFTCDPARIAFREIMNKLHQTPPRSGGGKQSLPPTVPTNSPVQSPNNFKHPFKVKRGTSHPLAVIRFSRAGTSRAK